MNTSRGPEERSALPRLLPLTGADGFLRAFDADTRRRNGASHLVVARPIVAAPDRRAAAAGIVAEMAAAAGSRK